MSDDSPAPEPAPVPETEPTVERDDAFELLWSRVLDGWNDPKTHGAFLEYAIQKQKLPDAAARYRPLKDDPERGADAKKRLDGIVLATTSLLMATATPRKARKTPVWLTALAFLVSVGLMFWVARAMLAR